MEAVLLLATAATGSAPVLAVALLAFVAWLAYRDPSSRARRLACADISTPVKAMLIDEPESRDSLWCARRESNSRPSA
jgi:hypothetical protein